MNKTKKIIAAVALIAALIAGVAGGLSVVKPQSRPAEATPEFQSILKDIEEITIVPHPAGSKENYRVRDLLIDQAKTAGLSVEVLPFEVAISDTEMLNLDNLFIKIKGTAPKGAAMFVSHYDSVSKAPGAADDGLAVSCMLNLMENMAKKPPANDVYFLFTDGEEMGLLGAADFVAAQPSFAEKVDVLFNFEARGNRGAMLMFETSGMDYELVRAFKNHVPQPVTMSIATAIYAMMPNGTDYTEFKNAGYYGLNFAMIEGDETYHQPSDNAENLNLDSAWQYYRNMEALGEYFGNTDLKDIEHTQTAQYFPLPLLGIMVLPGWLGYIVGFLPLLLALFLIIKCVRSDRRKGKILRITGLAVLGLLPALITVVFFSGSYMFSIPASLFLLADLFMEQKQKGVKIAGICFVAAAVLISGYLYCPLVLLVQVALKIWLATGILILLPLVPAVIYSIKAILCMKNTDRF